MTIIAKSSGQLQVYHSFGLEVENTEASAQPVVALSTKRIQIVVVLAVPELCNQREAEDSSV